MASKGLGTADDPTWASPVALAAMAALVLAGGFGGTASPASAAVIPEPANDPFYQPDPGFEATAPGTVRPPGRDQYRRWR